MLKARRCVDCGKDAIEREFLKRHRAYEDEGITDFSENSPVDWRQIIRVYLIDGAED